MGACSAATRPRPCGGEFACGARPGRRGLRHVAPVTVQAAGLVKEETTALHLGRRCVTSGTALMLAFSPVQVAFGAPASRMFTASPQDGGFSLLVPAGWEQLQLKPEAREFVGVYASWRDPNEASNTLGVYITPVSEPWSDIRSSGSLKQRAAQLAAAAPGQKTQAARERVDASGQRFYEVETLVGGGTAGRFGAAVEVLGETIYAGKRLQARATASLYSWRMPGTRDALRACISSFAVQH